MATTLGFREDAVKPIVLKWNRKVILQKGERAERLEGSGTNRRSERDDGTIGPLGNDERPLAALHVLLTFDSSLVTGETLRVEDRVTKLSLIGFLGGASNTKVSRWLVNEMYKQGS